MTTKCISFRLKIESYRTNGSDFFPNVGMAQHCVRTLCFRYTRRQRLAPLGGVIRRSCQRA